MFRSIRVFFQVNWIHTIIFNFRSFPFNIACKLPVLLFASELKSLGTVVIRNKKVFFGMIKLGLRHEDCCLSKKGVCFNNRGTVIFDGSMILGNGSSISVKENAVLEFGENSGMTGDISIHCQTSIILGKNLSCSWGVSISDTDLHTCTDPLKNEQKLVSLPVCIGNQVWLCQRSSVSKNTIIPDWCTLASNSLAVGNYSAAAPYSILAGCPAVVKSQLIRRDDVFRITKLSDWYITKGLTVFCKIR